MSVFSNSNTMSSDDFTKAWSSATQRIRNVAAAQRQQQKAQQAQQAAPKPSKTYTVTTTKGKQYTFDDDAYNWISNRYFRDNADSYGLDDADQYAKRTGQMSASMRKSYKKSTVDQKLAEMGLPSEKNFDKYLGEYNKWHTGGVDQVYGNTVSSEQWAKMGEMYKSGWTYDNTVEDQTRKALGLVPTKLLAEYADTELDESLMARGLPPSASLSKYNDQYNNYKGIDTLYKNAAGAITSLRVTPTDDGKYITNDDQRYTFNGQTMTGKQWYAKAFFDELERKDEQGNQVYGSLMPLFKNSNGIVGGDAGIDPTGDYANERGKIITSYAKNAGNAADYDNYNAFSYEDFAGKYGDYYDKYFKDIKDDNGQTVGGFLDVKAREADAEREKAFYTVEDKWFDGDKGIDAFVGRYMESYPGNSPEQMFTDMLEHGISEKTVKKAMRALANSAKENRSEDGTSGFYDIKDAYAKAKSNYDARNKEAKVDDGHTEELDMLYGPNGYDVVDGKVIPKAVEEPDAKAKYNAADKSRKEYVKTALKEAEDDQATIDATANAIQNALSGVTATDVDTVLDVIKSVEKQDFTNPVAVQLALTDLGFTGNLSGFADDLTDGWSQEDKNKLAFYLGGAQLTGIETDDYFNHFNRAEGDSLGDTWADTGYVQDRRKLRRADFAYNLEWAQEQIANGTPAGEVYNVLAGAGYQEEMEAYLPEEWRKAIFTDVTVPRMYEQSGGDNLAAWELMSPAERKATADKMWNEMSAEEKAKKYQNADWWKYDPDVYRTTGQAFEQQLTAVLPEFINNTVTSGVQIADSVLAGLSGRPDMWDTTKDLMKVQQGLAQFGKVYDETNGAAVADMVGTAAGEFLRMYTLGAVGSIAGEAFGATKAGTALANAAKNAGSWGVRKLADIGLSMATTLPFVVSSYAGSYAEAKTQGLSNGDAALYGATMGVIEGVTEGLNVDRVWGKAFGSDKFGKMIADGAKTVLGMSPVAAARLLSIPISGISEVTEELMSYTAETLWKQNINADSWGETPWDFKGFFKEAGLVSFITGAVGAGVSSGSITMESLLTDYALTDSKAFHQVFGQDLCTSIAVAENLPKSALEAYEKGGATMMSQEAYKFNDDKIEECNDGIESAGKTRDAAKVNAKNELDSALLEIDKVRSKLLGVDVQNADSVHEFMDLCNRLGIKIDLNQPIAQQAAAVLDARVKSLNDAYNTAIERADTTYENDKRQKEELRAGYEKKRQEHFVGLYLTNRDGIIAEMPDELIKNVAKTYQEGGKYDPAVAEAQRAERVNNAPEAVDEAAAAEYNNSVGELDTSSNADNGPDAYKKYLTPEFKKQASESDVAKGMKIPSLAYVKLAANNNVAIPYEILMQDPTIQEAERRSRYDIDTMAQFPEGTNPERDALRNRLVAQQLDENHGSAVFTDDGKVVYTGPVDKGFRAAIVMGPPAAGKSTMYADPLSNEMHARIPDSDIAKEGLGPEWDDGYGAGRVNKESSFIVKKVLNHFMDSESEHYGENIVIPKVGDDPAGIEELRARLEAAGYTVDLYLNDVDPATYKTRAISRFGTSQRYLRQDFLDNIGDVRASFEKLKESGKFNYVEHSSARGKGVQLVRPSSDGVGHSETSGQVSELGQNIPADAGSVSRHDVRGQNLEDGRRVVQEGQGSQGESQGRVSRAQAAINGSKVLSENERTKIAEHVKRIGFKGTLSFVNDPDQVFDGMIDENNNITLNLAYITSQDAKELKKNPGFWVLKHEFTHFIEGTKTYGDFFNAVKSQMTAELGEEGFAKAKQAYVNAAEKAGHPFEDETKVERDMVADYVGSQLFTSQKAIDSFVREQEGAASRVFNWLRYVIDRGKLRRQRNASALKILEAERMYSQAFRAANKRPAANNNADYSTPGIDYDLVKSRYGLNEYGDYVGVANPRTGVTQEEDARYMRLAKEGRWYKAGQMVRDMFERNGNLPGYHAGNRGVGEYTDIDMNQFSGKQYFLAENKDMSDSYTNRDRRIVRPINYGPGEDAVIDPDTGEVYETELGKLRGFVNDINDKYGLNFGIDHYYVDKNTGEVLVGEALEDAAPKDVKSSYVLVDKDTGLAVEDADTAIRLSRSIKQTYDYADNVKNPLEGSVFDLYIDPENANTHRGYNSVWNSIPDDSKVPEENVYPYVSLKYLPNGEKELTAFVMNDSGTYDVVTKSTADDGGKSIESLFSEMFGDGTYGNSAYDVFFRHAREGQDINGNTTFAMNDMYFDENGQLDPYLYGQHATDTWGLHDRDLGYDTTVFKDIYDYNASNPYSDVQFPGDVYIARNPNRVKSADPVVWDNKGNIVPLSLRGSDVNELRFSTPELSWDEVVKKYGTASATTNEQARNRANADAQLAEDLNLYGAIEQGREPRARDVEVPKQTNDINRVSQWIRSLIESGKLTDDQAQNVLRMVVEQDYGTYVPTSQAERMEEARAYIAERQPLQAQQEFHDMVMQGKFGVKTNALGIQLLSDASARGDFSSVLDIAADLQLAATEAGQSAQIFNVLKELKGVGSAWYMQKVIDRMNSKYADKIKSGKMKRISVDPTLMANLAKSTTVDQIMAAEEAVAKDIARQLPLTWDDRLSSWRYFSMLANPTTHIRNITGNLLMKGLNTAKDITAIGVQRAAEKLGLASESDRAHAWLTSEDKSIWGDWVQQSYEEQARNLSGGSKLGFESFVKQNMRSFDTKWVDALARFNFKLLEGEDIAFIRPAYKNALMQYMKAQGYTLNGKGQAGKVDAKGKFHEMTKAQMNEAIDWASQQAWKQTFRDASSLATMLNKLSKENAVSRLLVEGVMPFKKTPINIARRGVDYSPAGIIKGIAQLTNGVKKGKVTTAQAIDTLSSGITGSALMALGVMLAKLGIIRAGGEKDKKLETYLEDTGDQTYAIKFGDKSINMSSIAPATIPLFMGVALNEMIEQSGETIDLSTITDTIAGTLNPFMEMSFMASLNSALKNYNNNGIGGALGSTLMTAAQNYGSQYLPTLGGKIAQFFDPTRRTTKSDATSAVGGNMDYYLRSLAKKVPGLEATLQPDVDVWGRTDTKDSFGDWALDFANKFILPTNVKVSNRDAVDNELISVVENTGVTDFLPSDGEKKFRVNKVDYVMNAKQYSQYSQERGQAAYAAYKDLMASPSYQSASYEEKATMLKKTLDAAYKVVNNTWKEKLGAFDK